MPSFTAPVWPSPGRFALALILGFVLTLAAASVWGTALVEALLPITHTLLGWIDGRFGVLFLGVEHNWQDTVIRLQLGFSRRSSWVGAWLCPTHEVQYGSPRRSGVCSSRW